MENDSYFVTYCKNYAKTCIIIIVISCSMDARHVSGITFIGYAKAKLFESQILHLHNLKRRNSAFFAVLQISHSKGFNDEHNSYPKLSGKIVVNFHLINKLLDL